MRPYDPKDIESRWQKVWEGQGLYEAKDFSDRPKYYSLVEFPYPSGEGLHTGHIKGFTAMDIISRKRRMQGYNVLYPIGWDAFGLPTENYAIKTKTHPKVVTKNNTDIFRDQLKAVGFSFDWTREINTTDPEYYKWTQWIFLKLFEKGLAYKKKTFINWCTSCKIGLANEEVVGGVCERCGGVVEKREKEQWMLAITKYAERLYNDLDQTNFPDMVKIQQRNWIGPSEGAEIDFTMAGKEEISIKVFTTRPDTLFGVTYVVVAPEHPLIDELTFLAENKVEVDEYVNASRKKTDLERTADEREKTGVELKGVKVVNPASGESVPLFVADYVLGDYGTGAVMAVPAHDVRDFAFAHKNRLPVVTVVREDPQKSRVKFLTRSLEADWKEKLLNYNSSELDDCIEVIVSDNELNDFISLGQSLLKTGPYYFSVRGEKKLVVFKDKIFDIFSYDGVAKDYAKNLSVPAGELNWSTAFVSSGIMVNSGKFDGRSSEEVKKEITDFAGGKWVKTYKLRDWVFSRQRYWGEPIPMVKCPKDGWVSVPEGQLPVTLPNVDNYQPTDNGESPLAVITDWVRTTCPKCGGPAERETDTMPNWAGSSWYFLRYIDPHNEKFLADIDKLKYWGQVDWYNGGPEHITLHLLYSRFWNKFLNDIGVVPSSEPYLKRSTHGMVLGEGGVKMSKSKGNVINPDKIVKFYGADTLRLYEMFMGPFGQSIAWDEKSIIGSRRFLEKVWRLAGRAQGDVKNDKIEVLTNQTIAKVSEDIEEMGFNTAISQMMILANELDKEPQIDRELFKKLLLVLAPFAPHITEELWHELGDKSSIHATSWPLADPNKLVQSVVKIGIQVNGKVRAELEIALGSSEDMVKNKAIKLPELEKWLSGKEVKKVIFVPDRLLGFVV